MYTYLKRLKELRKEMNTSTWALAKEIEVSHSSIVRWENAQADVSLESLLKLAKFFKVSLDYLAGLED